MTFHLERLARRETVRRLRHRRTLSLADWRRSQGPFVWVFLFMAWGALFGAAREGLAAWVRPLEGSGNFHSMIDMYSRPGRDGAYDVMLLVSVANRELTFIRQNGRFVGRLEVSAELLGQDGGLVQGTKNVLVQTASEAEANSATLYQVFPLLLRGVTASSGQVACRLMDQNRKRRGLLNLVKNRQAVSEAAGDWEAPAALPEANGLNLNDPIFLSGAPLDLWRSEGRLSGDLEQTGIMDYLHPNRRYGLEQERLQIFFEVAPPTDGDLPRGASAGLFVQVLAKDLDFALRDTIVFNDPRLASLVAGQPAAVYYELDVNQLPAGAYQLTCAPGNGQGRGWLAEFDVIWSLHALNKHGDELEGEGRTVFLGSQLKDFLDAGQAEREVMLEEFWADLDPTPESPLNENYLEFRRRISYVRQHLGGFGRLGPADDRGDVYLLLGPPNEMQIENMPLNATDFDDAVIKVHNKFAPDRPGTWAKGSNRQGTQGKGPYEKQDGGIPMPDNYTSRQELAAVRQTVGRDKAFQLWKYDHTGQQLFPNKFSGQSLGVNFLFVDRTGTGHYVLETSNAFNIGD
jgi:GWxTD domain-containing protein